MHPNPIIAIIVPIYNVEKYLQVCLDSVIGQTYRDLQIILIDDASTDNSFEIAYDYFMQDTRIALIKNKQNQGVGASRNLALDYLAMQNVWGGGRIEIFEHSRCKEIQYIHFLDSDDWLDLECIERCVKQIQKSYAQILWHDYKIFNHQNQKFSSANSLKRFDLEDQKIYRGMQILGSLKVPSFSWSTMGIISFEHLLKHRLRFEEWIESEDALFGIQLFALAEKVEVLEFEGYIYRIRPHSISQHTLTKDTKEMHFPQSYSDLMAVFDTPYEVRHYHFAYSACIFCLKMHQFLRLSKISETDKGILKKFINYRIQYAFGALGFRADPRGCRVLCEQLKPYMSSARIGSKVAFYFPRFYHFFKRVFERVFGIRFG